MLRAKGSKGSKGSGSQSSSLRSWRGRSFVALERKELVDAVFASLDVHKTQLLGASELKEFARRTGFEGSEEQWQEQFGDTWQPWRRPDRAS